MKGTIQLNGMKFRACHGCLPSERRDGNDFVVDFSCEYDLGPASVSDNLDDTLNYAVIYDIVAAQMAIPSKLLEHVAGRIVRVIQNRFPELQHMRVSIAKLNPPVDGPVAESRITIEI